MSATQQINMDNQGSSASNSKSDFQEISVSQSDKIPGPFSNQIEGNISRSNESLTYRDQGVFVMSKEELNIRSELEIDIERGLEQEIKEELCGLALRLHRLYQHKSERIATSRGKSLSIVNGSQRSSISPAEMTITIRTVLGGSGIEIQEIKKGTRGKGRSRPPRTSYSFSNYKQGRMNSSTGNAMKNFKWETTLRSGNVQS